MCIWASRLLVVVKGQKFASLTDGIFAPLLQRGMAPKGCITHTRARSVYKHTNVACKNVAKRTNAGRRRMRNRSRHHTPICFCMDVKILIMPQGPSTALAGQYFSPDNNTARRYEGPARPTQSILSQTKRSLRPNPKHQTTLLPALIDC